MIFYPFCTSHAYIYNPFFEKLIFVNLLSTDSSQFLNSIKEKVILHFEGNDIINNNITKYTFKKHLIVQMLIHSIHFFFTDIELI